VTAQVEQLTTQIPSGCTMVVEDNQVLT